MESPIQDQGEKHKETIKTVKRSNKDYLTKTKDKIPKMFSLEPENEAPAPWMRKDSKKHIGVFDEVHAEPFEIIENQYFKKLIKGMPPKSELSIYKTPNNNNFDIQKTEKKIQTSSFLDSSHQKPFHGTIQARNNYPKENFKTISEYRTFNKLAALQAMAHEPM